MRSKGELPAGMNLSVSDYYRKMVGSGELWVAENGLPLRQILTLQFPEQNDETVNAQIKVDFSNFGTGNALQSTSSVNSRVLQVSRVIGLTSENLGALATLLMSLGLVAFVLRYHRLRKLQHALSLAVIISLFVGPALSTIKQVQFMDAVSTHTQTQSPPPISRHWRKQSWQGAWLAQAWASMPFLGSTLLPRLRRFLLAQPTGGQRMG